MQELIDWIDEIDNSVFALSAPSNELKMLSDFKRKANEFLEAERKQIVDSYNAGHKEDNYFSNSPEDYYNNTYNGTV